ncbi:hypothetical protein BDR26DRAFT_1010869 [Obelidium mucronatum]|nr:hypothetical protein BDR26DRAFT_1010869 [Obelidium mucronatum]
MRCTFGCRKQFKKQADLARHAQFKHSQAVRQALAATSVTEQDTTTKTTETLEEGYEDIENEIPSPDLQAIEDSNMDNEFDDFPDEIPELHSRYGVPVDNSVSNHELSVATYIRQQFTGADLDFMQHVILDNPMGQTAITFRLQPEHVPTFKTGKDLHQRLDSSNHLSVDYKKANVLLSKILSNLATKYHPQARAYYQRRPCFLYLRSMRDLIRLRLQDSSLQSNFAYCFTKQFNSAGERLYDEAYSGDYCEELQNQLPNGATPLLVIFSSDAALATKIGKQSFHPLILDFGNIKKSLRKKLNSRSSILVTYLPIVSPMKKSDAFLTAYRRAVTHSALELIMFDIKDWIKDGADLISPDGRLRKFFPCLFNFNGDYPEQTLFSTVSPLCKSFPMPCCLVPADCLSECGKSCLFWGVKTTEAMTRSFQRWIIREVNGDAGVDTVDSRFALVPNYPGFNHYSKGVSSLSQLTKKDFKSIMMQLLPCVVDLVQREVTICLRTFLDIAMLVSNTSHTCASLDSLEGKLVEFDGQLDVFRREKDMNFPKMHTLSCFRRAITRFGGSDSFGTEHMEATQQFNVVKAYARTNHKNSEEQMIRHVTRMDKVFAIRRLLAGDFGANPDEASGPQKEKVVSLVSAVSGFYMWNLDSHLPAYRGFEQKLKRYFTSRILSDGLLLQYQTLKLVDYDEDNREVVDFIRITAKSQNSFCIYRSLLVKPPPMELGLAGTTLFVGKPLRFFAVPVEGNGNMLFALVQRYKELPTASQNETGCFILKPVTTAGGFIIIPAAAIEARGHMVPYFQDGQEGGSGQVYLNPYAEKYIWASIGSSQDAPHLSDSEEE